MTTIKLKLLDELLAGISSFEDVTGEAGLFMQLKTARSSASTPAG
jgi:hypothetical protein